jgi:hypothetical protein
MLLLAPVFLRPFEHSQTVNLKSQVLHLLLDHHDPFLCFEKGKKTNPGLGGIIFGIGVSGCSHLD